MQKTEYVWFNLIIARKCIQNMTTWYYSVNHWKEHITLRVQLGLETWKRALIIFELLNRPIFYSSFHNFFLYQHVFLWQTWCSFMGVSSKGLINSVHLWSYDKQSYSQFSQQTSLYPSLLIFWSAFIFFICMKLIWETSSNLFIHEWN